MTLAVGIPTGHGHPRTTAWRAGVNPGHAAYVDVCAGDVCSERARGRPDQTEPNQERRALGMTRRHEKWSREPRVLSALALRVGRSPVTHRVGGAAVLGFVVWRLGFDSSLHALGAIDGWSLGLAVVLTALTTSCCAWRWSLVAAGLGTRVPLLPAVAACYRSQFVNTATPGGVLGDVHRGVRLGRQHGDTGKGVRSVFWERSAGQVVQAVMALGALTLLPSPVRPLLGWVWFVVLASVVCGLVWRLSTRRRRAGLRAGRRSASRRPDEGTRALATATWAELRRALFARRTLPLVVVASGLAVTGHVMTFVVAARTAGATAPTARLVPLAFVVLVSMGVPVNLAGWGPREGVAAWAFGAAGLGADAGLSTAVVYGVLVFAASLPGAVVMLVAGPWHARRARRAPAESAVAGSPQLVAATGEPARG